MYPQTLRHAPILLLLLMVALGIHRAAGQDDLSKKCGDEFQKLSECLPYATAKTDKPSDKCCETANGIRQRDPVCLCYIIEQSQKSGSSGASIGVQYNRIFKLPDMCSIPNANATLCPKLLHIPPGSPDNAIFNGSATTQSTSNITTTSNGSVGRMHFGSVIVAIATAVASSVF